MKSSIGTILLLSLLVVSCGEKDPRDIPYGEFSISDSAAGMEVLNNMTQEEQELMAVGFMAAARDTNALKKLSINQLIEKGREIQRIESR